MGGFFGVASKEDCVFDLFFGIDYHSHLGTRRAGMAVYDMEDGFQRSIHNISNSPFRTKFISESHEMHGNFGIGCISDFEAQPILMRSNHGSFAITTVGKINNSDELVNDILKTHAHFFEMQTGGINQTELVAALINQKENFIEGIKYAQEVIDGSMSMLILTPKGIYAARDRLGRTPVVIAKKDNSYCAGFESFACNNLGFETEKFLEPGEIVVFDAESVKTLAAPGKDMKICTFLWVYYGFPASTYENMNVEQMRYNCGRWLAKRDEGLEADLVAGLPDSGVAHSVGYSNESGIRHSRPFVKYTPSWARSFMPTHQDKRNLIAKMKLVPIRSLIEDQRLLLIDDSIVRGTQLGETTQFLYDCGAKEVHIRTGCPPILFGCKYLNFSRSNSPMELIARRIIVDLEGGEPSAEVLAEYANPDSEKYANMVEAIRKELNFTSLKYLRLDDMLDATGLPTENLCTYCWTGKED